MSTAGETDDYPDPSQVEETREMKQWREKRLAHQKRYGFSDWCGQFFDRTSGFLKGEPILVQMLDKRFHREQLIAIAEAPDHQDPPTTHFIAKVLDTLGGVAMIMNTGRMCSNPTFKEDCEGIAADYAGT